MTHIPLPYFPFTLTYVEFFFFALLGAVLGSFYACIVQRYVNESPIFTKRSQCVHCKKQLKIIHLIPIFSFLLLKGKCASCKEKISIFYPIIEIISALTTCLIIMQYGFSFSALFFLIITSILLIASFIDLQSMILPDIFTIWACACVIPFGIIFDILPLWQSILGSLLAGCTSLILYAYFLYIRKIHALGLGDVKFLFLLGAIVGINNVPYLFLIASLSGIFFLLIQYFSLSKNIWKIAIPFGPFLSFSCMILYIFYPI